MTRSSKLTVSQKWTQTFLSMRLSVLWSPEATAEVWNYRHCVEMALESCVCGGRCTQLLFVFMHQTLFPCYRNKYHHVFGHCGFFFHNNLYLVITACLSRSECRLLIRAFGQHLNCKWGKLTCQQYAEIEALELSSSLLFLLRVRKLAGHPWWLSFSRDISSNALASDVSNFLKP